MREFYITDKAGNYIEDINEAINNTIEEIKICYQFRKNKSFRYKIRSECEYKKRTKEEVKITKIFFNTDYNINNAIYDRATSNNGWILKKEYMEAMATTLSFSD